MRRLLDVRKRLRQAALDQAAFEADAPNRAAYEAQRAVWRARMELDERAGAVIGLSPETEWPALMDAHPTIDWETWASPEPPEPSDDNLVPYLDEPEIARLQASWANLLKNKVYRRIVDRLDQEEGRS